MDKLMDILGWGFVVGIIVWCLWYLFSVSPVDIYEFFEALEKVK